LPEDASETARYLASDADAHSASWMPIAEAAGLFLRTEYEPLSDFDREFLCCLYFGVEEESDFSRHRFVFWFDC
jgi:hypothetical protein